MFRVSLPSSTPHILWCVLNRMDYASNKIPKPSPKHRQPPTVVPSYSHAPASFSFRGHHTAGSVADLTDLIDLSGRLHPKWKISRYKATSWQENCSASQNTSHPNTYLNGGQRSALQRWAWVYSVQRSSFRWKKHPWIEEPQLLNLNRFKHSPAVEERRADTMRLQQVSNVGHCLTMKSFNCGHINLNWIPKRIRIHWRLSGRLETRFN